MVFLDHATRQVQANRVWKEVEPLARFHVPNSEYPDLYRPADVKAAPGGGVLIYDFSEMKVKRFDRTGSFLVEYGEGIGQGPGELQAMMDTGTADSLIYIVDDTNARFSYYDPESGDYVRQELMEADRIGRVARAVDTPSGGRYILVGRQPHLFVYTSDSFTNTFGSLIQNQQPNYQVLNGRLATADEDLIYVTSYYPRMYRFDTMGALKYVRATIDQDFNTTSGVEVQTSGRTILRRARGLLMNGHVGVDDDYLWIHSRTDTSRTYAALDFYDLSTGDYEWSIRIPEGAGYLYLDDEIVYSLTDTLVTGYSVPGWRE